MAGSTFAITTGLSSGIDYNALISGLMSVEQQPLTQLQNKQTDYQNKLDTYNQLNTKVTALQKAADILQFSTGYSSNSLSVADSSILTATSTANATAGKYTIAVTQLAQQEKEVHSGVASATTVVNSSGSDKAFQYTYGGKQTTVAVKSGDTLQDLADSINNDTNNPGVTATVLNDGTNYRLVLTGASSGDSNGITVDSGTTLDGTGSVDFTASSFTQTSKAQSAIFTVDGTQITRDTNTISDVITGVTFTLEKANKTTPPSTTIEIKPDTSTATTNFQSLVSAYNDLRSFIDQNSTYDTTTNTGGELFSESTARDLMTRIQSVISSPISGLSSSMSSLSQAGINLDQTGVTLSMDSSAFATALSSNSADALKMLKAVSTSIYNATKNATDLTYGSLTLREKSLQSTITQAGTDITDMQARLTQIQTNYQNQFTQLEMTLNDMKTQGSYISSITSWATVR